MDPDTSVAKDCLFWNQWKGRPLDLLRPVARRKGEARGVRWECLWLGEHNLRSKRDREWTGGVAKGNHQEV